MLEAAAIGLGLFTLLLGALTLIGLGIGVIRWVRSRTDTGRTQTRGHDLGFWQSKEKDRLK